MSNTPQSTETKANTDFSMTDRAAARILALRAAQNNPALCFRITVQGGGCSGFQYDFKLDEQKNAEDVTIAHQGAEVLIDEVSLPFLQNSQLDYEVTLGSAQFIITNPNATAQCGCGKSFSV